MQILRKHELWVNLHPFSHAHLICETWRDEAALEAHAASEPFVKNVAIINDCGEMKIEKFDML